MAAVDGAEPAGGAQKSKSDGTEGGRELDISSAARRGLPKITVSTAEPVVDASGDFSIFVVIENPFDVSITIYSVQTHIPIELIDTVWLQKYHTAALAERDRQLGASTGFRKAAKHVGFLLSMAYHRIFAPTNPRIAEAVGADEEARSFARPMPSEARIEVGRDVIDANIIAGSPFADIWHLNFPTNPSNAELDQIFMKVEDYRRGKVPAVLQPGDSVVKHFILRAKNKLLFRPIAYNFQIQIRYGLSEQEHLITTPFNVQIRAALKCDYDRFCYW